MAIATDEEDPLNEPDKLVSTLVMPKQVAPTPVERTQQLLKDLQPESETLSEEEKEKWRAFLFEYRHLFALDKSELGSTNIITHSIDTGDHPPIRQPVRHDPLPSASGWTTWFKRCSTRVLFSHLRVPGPAPSCWLKRGTVTQDFVWITEN